MQTIIEGTPSGSIHGLAANNFYEVYVRAFCGTGDTSYYTGPIVFNTFGLGQWMEHDTDC